MLSASNEALPPVLRALSNRFPEAELFLYAMRPDRIVRRLYDKQIDAGFLYLPLDGSSPNVECLSRDPLVLAETHPLTAETRAKLQALAEDRFILPARYQSMPGLHDQVIEACRQAGFVPNAV